ncbi:hypothetical protein [Rhizobium sp. BK060]|uniref:hypothetical protein n=1 Tax=Rhizobium sp. BK060 TaxID=2587096 RepID=UPI0016225333|nr:hypothetical protein [Rhizobium sp. BK060]MBB3396839.1 hypothetical protein [Rhizobium sp. BK060]
MTSTAMFHKPTLKERLLRKAGFRYHLGDEPEGIEQLKGWMRTDIRLDFSLADRLRLLLTGRLFVASIVHTDTPSASVCKSRVDWRIFAPGERS